MTTRLAHRVSLIGSSPTIAVMAEAKRLKKAGVDVIDLGPGEPDFPTPEPIRAAGARAIEDGFTKYTPVPGIPELRQGIAESYNGRYGTQFRPENVIVGAGGKQTLFNACLAIFQEGDEVLVPTPCWVSYPEMIKLSGATSKLVRMKAEDGFKIRRREIEAAWTERTHGVMLSSPANPHGTVIEASELEAIVELASERGGVIVFDECYDWFVYGREHVTASNLFERHPDAVLLAGSFSKTYSMTGWRIGYMLGEEKAIAATAKIQSHSTTNASSIAQQAAMAALAPEGVATIAPMIEEFRKRRDVMMEGLAGIPGVRCFEPEGAFYLFPDVSSFYDRPGITGSVELSKLLLDKARVAVVPGAAFEEDAHIRLSFATSMKHVEESIRRMKEFFAEL